MTDEPNNPAEALDRLLWRVTQSGLNSLAAAWSSVLGADIGSVEFVDRHSAVAGLVNELRTFLQALPDGHELKTRHLSDIPAYYNTVVFNGDWNGINPVKVIDPNLIKLLGGLGTTLKVMAAGNQMVEGDVAKLEASLDAWETMLDSAGLPDGLTDQIRGQVLKIRDLLGQADKFGYGPVIKESQSLLGYGIRAAKVAKDVVAVMTCVTGLFEFIAHVQVQDWGAAANAITGGFSMMGDALETARQAEGTGRLALERGEQLALEAGKAAKAVNDVLGEDDEDGEG